MDRIVFAKMLVAAKHKAKLTTSELVFKMHALPNAIYRIESAAFSFSMEKCFSYLRAIGYAIRFSKGGRDVDVFDMPGLLEWEINTRGQISRPAFAEKLGCNRSYIRLIEAGTNVMSIDFVLKIAEAFKYEISLVRYQYE